MRTLKFWGARGTIDHRAPALETDLLVSVTGAMGSGARGRSAIAACVLADNLDCCDSSKIIMRAILFMMERTEPSSHGPLDLAKPMRPSRGNIARALARSPVSLAPTSPDVYAFQDFRVYLATWFQWKKQVQPHYSGAIFAKKAGFNSHTLLGMVIRGQRNLSATSIRVFLPRAGPQGQGSDLLREARALQSGPQPGRPVLLFEQLLAVPKAKGKAPLVWTTTTPPT